MKKYIKKFIKYGITKKFIYIWCKLYKFKLNSRILKPNS